MLKNFVKILGGDPNKRIIEKYALIAGQIEALEAHYEEMGDEELSAQTPAFKQRLVDGETLDDLLPEAFAVVREASKRTLGLRPYDVQMIGGIALHKGSIAEMRTGEGKTLVATLPVYLNALTGRGVHLVTVNDYLARRDARWMAPVYHLLGLTVGVLQMASRTENGKKAFVVDLQKESPHEDQHQLRMTWRSEAYQTDIVYGTNSEFGFDYLRDNMTMRLEERVQRGHYFAIIDEVDNILVDEARTPLIISGPAQDESEFYVRMAQVVRHLRPEDYEVNEKDRNVTLSEIGEVHVEELLGTPLRDPDRPEDVTPEQARLIGVLEQALRAQFLFRRNKDYLVQAGKVVIVDEFTGRLMPGRRWSDGLHQAVEAKEGVRVQAENMTYATITIQNYFRMYEKLSGMTGTALTEAEEFDKIYKLEVVAIPTNLEYQASRPESGLLETESKDEEGYKYRYYARRQDPSKVPVYWKRKDYPDVVYRSEEAKFRAICREILRYHSLGRPILVGTTSVELSERLSNRLKAEPLRRLAQTLLLRDRWFTKNNRVEDGMVVPELTFLNQPLDDLSIPEMRKLARDLGVSFNPQDDENLNLLCEMLSLPLESRDRLSTALQGGISHQVLNARKHTEESQIIAGAGALGAVTIATNMAGRGVDIRLGGEIPEDVIGSVRLLLRRSDIAERLKQSEKFAEDNLYSIDDLPLSRWPDALALVDASELRSRAAAVDKFMSFVSSEEQVRQVGGLHVIGSERHEARRIDNQLRGRSARQGDPGSSRFYLSMEDELMRLFGGQQAESLMQRLRLDDSMPLEVGMVSRLIEQSQSRVEGANFDVRKHLLEYDDVLNAQRKMIYAQRDRIFSKEDLSEDVEEILVNELQVRIPEALQAGEGAWRLLAWLDQVQPTLDMGYLLYPSFTMKLLVDHLAEKKDQLHSVDNLRQKLLLLASEALNAEKDHLLRVLRDVFSGIFDRLETQLKEAEETLGTFLEGLELGDEETAPRSPRELADELSGLLRIPLRLSGEQQRLLRDQPEEVEEIIRQQVDEGLRLQAVTRFLGATERRLEEELGLTPNQLVREDWDVIESQALAAVENVFNQRIERLIGMPISAQDGATLSGGQIGRDLDNTLGKINGAITSNQLISLLLLMPQGARSTFDRRTHRRVMQRTTRLVYTYLAAQLLEDRSQDEISESVLEHLQQALGVIRVSWGLTLWPRMAGATWNELDEQTQNSLLRLLGEERCEFLQQNTLQNLEKDEIQQIHEELGRRGLTAVYRQLLLSVITELWVDYLTQMEGLRVSIGLEAYAQRDPLVQYKSRASEMFQNLLKSIRQGVVTRMFTYRPRNLSSLEFTEKRSLPEDEGEEAEQVAEAAVEATAASVPEIERKEDLSTSQKRRRRRR
jgi:preprotein translocase subunit SecA